MDVLVLQLKRIGDLALTTPALAALKEGCPGVRVTLCVAEGSGGLVPALPFVDEVFVVRRLGRNLPLLVRLARAHFDVCLDFTGNDRSALFTFLSKARRRIAFGWVRKSQMRTLAYTEFVESSIRERHTVDHYLDLLEPLGVEAQGTTPVLHLPEEARQRAEVLLEAQGLEGQKFAIVHPGTARIEKYWLPERWAEVLDYCQNELRLPCLLTGAQDFTETQHLKAIIAAARTPVRNLAGSLDLLTLAALIERAELLLSMDSAPVHLAAAFGTRQVALFGETNPFHWRPRHEKAAVLLAGEEEPLTDFQPRCPQRPLSDLSTRVLIRAIHSLL